VVSVLGERSVQSQPEYVQRAIEEYFPKEVQQAIRIRRSRESAKNATPESALRSAIRRIYTADH
jgi:hypothetical protein